MTWMMKQIERLARKSGAFEPEDVIIDGIAGHVRSTISAGAELPLTRARKIGKVRLLSQHLISVICFSERKLVFVGDRKMFTSDLAHMSHIDRNSETVLTISCMTPQLYQISLDVISSQDADRFIGVLRHERDRRRQALDESWVQP
jgi:hypothetical protein